MPLTARPYIRDQIGMVVALAPARTQLTKARHRVAGRGITAFGVAAEHGSLHSPEICLSLNGLRHAKHDSWR
jgi:hypothetical protein